MRDTAIGAANLDAMCLRLPRSSTQIREFEVDNVWSPITVNGLPWRPRGSVMETTDGTKVEVWHQYDEVV